MVTEEEAVTLKQFKVWASKQGGGGGGSSPDPVVLWEGRSDVPPDVTADRAYRFAVVVANGTELCVPWGRYFSVYLGGGSNFMLIVTFSGDTIRCITTPQQDGGSVEVTLIGATD